MPVKVSPFVLSDDTLDRLVVAATGEPAVLDLVGLYKRAADDLSEVTEMIHAEMDHFGVA